MTDELRGSAPVYSAKEVLLRIDERTERLDRNVSVLMSQKLDERVDSLEASRDKDAGRYAAIAGIVAGAISLGGLLLSALKVFG